MCATILAGIFLVLLVATWRKFGDPFLDYGITLYGPFQVSKGLHVARDFEWLYGPLSVYFNGGLFAWFGPHNTVLLVANLFLLIGGSLLVFRLFSQWYGCIVATAITVIFWLVFAFSHSTKVGMYNYFAPYSSETVHGLYLGLCTVALAQQWIRVPTWLETIGLALLAALAFLTKAEMAVGALAVWGGAYLIAAFFWTERKRWVKAALLGAATVVGTLCTIFLVACLVMPPSRAIELVLGAWWMSFTPAARVRWSVETMGFESPWSNAARLLLSASAVVSLGIVFVLLARAWRQWRLSKTARILGLGIVTVLCVVCFRRFEWWQFFARSLPLWCLAIWGAKSLSVLQRQESNNRARDIGIWLWSLWALGTILRMLLNARVEQYGFTQAMPAVLVCAAWLLGDAPRIAVRANMDRFLTILVVTALVFSFTYAHAKRSWNYLQQKRERWSTSTVDMFVFDTEIDPRVPVLRSAMHYMQNVVPSTDKFIAIPEGAFFAFSLGKLMATRYPQLTPTEVAGFGEGAIVADYNRQRPDVIVVIHKHTRPWLFGQSREYGQEIMQWVHSHSQREILFGDEPHRSEKTFGIEIRRCH
ncbi:MAG: hypothetical protein ACP5QZ_01220 [Candidatus Sumerlaeaceae bacterium]